MAAAVPPPVGSPTPPPKTAPAPAAPLPPPTGELRDDGTVRRDSVVAARWNARGLVKVTGDVRLGEGSLEGTVTVGGRVTAEVLRYQGSLDVEGAAEVRGTCSGSGTLRVAQSFHAGDADLRGNVRLAGSATVDRVLGVRGSLVVASSLTVGELRLEGEAQVAGDLGGLAVDARFEGDSSFETIRARSVVLRARPPNLMEKVFQRRVTVTVARVEADSVELEEVDARFVRAPQITLGPGAHITEYEGTIVKRHPSSRVGFESKSPPPYGLRR